MRSATGPPTPLKDKPLAPASVVSCVHVDKAVLLGHAPAGGTGGDDGDDAGFGDDKTYASAASSRERRRLSIKAAKVRRRKQEVEITAMEAEDERSKLENQAHRVSWVWRNLVVKRLSRGLFESACESRFADRHELVPAKCTFVTVFRCNALQAMLEIRLQRRTEMERKAAAMRRQMAAEVSASGGGQTAASIVHSMDSGSTGGGGGSGGGGCVGGDGSLTEGGSVGTEGGAGEVGGIVESVDAGAGPTLFDVSSRCSSRMLCRFAFFTYWCWSKGT